MEVQRDPIFRLPVSAPVEKGMLATAVLEETGAIGALMFLVLLGSLLVPAARKGNFCHLWLGCTCLAVNFGESVFLSFGGMGLFIWLIIGYALFTPGRGSRPSTSTAWPLRPGLATGHAPCP